MLFVLLGAFVLTGLSRSDAYLYGNKLSERMPREAQYLVFTGQSNRYRSVLVLWNHTDHTNRNQFFGKAEGRSWVIDRLTQAHNGDYVFKDSRDRKLRSFYVSVYGHESDIELAAGERFEHSFPVPMDSCDLLYSQGGYRSSSSEYIIKGGVVQDHALSNRLSLSPESASSFLMTISSLRSSDTGHFNLQDEEGNDVALLKLTVFDAELDFPTTIGVVAGIIAVLLCCCCGVVKCCCGKKKSTKTVTAVTQSEQPQVNYYHNHSSETSPPDYRYQPPARTHPSQNPGQAYLYPTAGYHSPLVHNPADNTAASAQPEVGPVAAQEAVPPPPIGAQCVSTDPEPRFELKGLSFAANPLNSDPVSADVYTSSKLNFL